MVQLANVKPSNLESDRGKLWVRERVEQLLDPGSFQEVGSVSGTVKWKQLGPSKEEPEEYVPSNNVQGMHNMLSQTYRLLI